MQFTTDTVPASELFRGRIEHIDSGRSRRFDSLASLVAFVTEVFQANDRGD